MKYRNIVTASFCGLLLSLSTTVWSQQGDDLALDPYADATTDNFDLLFDDIPSVFAASKHEQKVTEAPASVSIVTADEIKRYGYRTLSDILRSVRGFYVVNDRNYGYVGVRGFGQPGDYNSRLLLMVDGHRVSEAIYDSFGVEGNFGLDVDLIDRVEIVRGPGSSLYGTSAFFGVINITTKSGRDYKGAELAAEAGSQNTTIGRATWGSRFDNGLELLLSASQYKSDGEDQAYFPEFDDPTTNNGVYENNDATDARNLFAKLEYGGLSLDVSYYDWLKEIPTASYKTVFNDPRTFTEEEQLQVGLSYSHTFAFGAEWSSRLTYGQYEYFGDFAYDYSEDGDLSNVVLNKDQADSNWWVLESQFSHALSESQRLIGGVEYRNNAKLDQKNFDNEVYLDERHDSEVVGVYVQDEIKLYDTLTLNLGLRYDRYDSFGDNISPRLAVIYSPQQRTSIKLLYGEAFRAPNTYELYYNFLETESALELEPETITSYELVFEHYIEGDTLLTASVYSNQIDDLISYLDEDRGFSNTSSIDAQGIEMGVETRFGNGIRGQFSYAYQQAEDDATGDALVNSPKHMAKLNLIAPLFSERAYAGLELQYLSRRKTQQAIDADAYTVTNLTVSSDKLLPGLSLSASLYNLFDAKIEDPGSTDHKQAVIEQDGRKFLIRASYQF